MQTIEELKVLCREWQEKLRLLDWDIQLDIGRHRDLDALGSCSASTRLKWAHIILLDEQDFDQVENALPKVTEVSLVHELLHVMSAGYDSRDEGRLRGYKDRAHEVMVETLAQLLVRQKYEKELDRVQGKMDGLNQAVAILEQTRDNKRRRGK